MQNSQAYSKKKSTKVFWRAGQVILRLNFHFFAFLTFHWWSSWSPPSRTGWHCLQPVQTTVIVLQDLSGLCAHAKSNPLMAIHVCPTCCVALHPLAIASYGSSSSTASVLTYNTSVSASMQSLGGSQQQIAGRLHFPLCLWLFWVSVDNPGPSYRAENPTFHKIGQKYQPDIRISPAPGDRKGTPKIPEKGPQNYDFRFLGGIQGGI